MHNKTAVQRAAALQAPWPAPHKRFQGWIVSAEIIGDAVGCFDVITHFGERRSAGKRELKNANDENAQGFSEARKDKKAKETEKEQAKI